VTRGKEASGRRIEQTVKWCARRLLNTRNCLDEAGRIAYMTENSRLSAELATELHNRVARQVVAQIINETKAAGGSYSDLLVICESVLVGVVVECFKLGHDGKVIDLLFTAAKDRLAKVRLEDLHAKGTS
jgi:hypothetical protein